MIIIFSRIQIQNKSYRHELYLHWAYDSSSPNLCIDHLKLTIVLAFRRHLHGRSIGNFLDPSWKRKRGMHNCDDPTHQPRREREGRWGFLLPEVAGAVFVLARKLPVYAYLSRVFVVVVVVFFSFSFFLTVLLLLLLFFLYKGHGLIIIKYYCTVHFLGGI